MIWWFHCPNLIISTTLQSDLFSPTKLPGFAWWLGRGKWWEHAKKATNDKGEVQSAGAQQCYRRGEKNCQKKTEKPWGILTSEMVFLKIEFGWYVMYVVWMVCDESFPFFFFQRFIITQVMGPLSHPLTSAWVQPFSTKVHLWLEWLGHCMGWGISRSAERNTLFWMPPSNNPSNIHSSAAGDWGCIRNAQIPHDWWSRGV